MFLRFSSAKSMCLVFHWPFVVSIEEEKSITGMLKGMKRTNVNCMLTMYKILIHESTFIYPNQNLYTELQAPISLRGVSVSEFRKTKPFGTHGMSAIITRV